RGGQPHRHAGQHLRRHRRHRHQHRPGLGGAARWRCGADQARSGSEGSQAPGARGAHHPPDAGYHARIALPRIAPEPGRMKEVISTPRAPAAIGTYSQAVKTGNLVFCSGQIPLDPDSMEMISDDIDAEIARVFDNLKAVAEAAGGTLDHAVKVNVYLTDLAHFARVNEAMASYFRMPYPARAAVQVAALPRNARVEVECVLSL